MKNNISSNYVSTAGYLHLQWSSFQHLKNQKSNLTPKENKGQNFQNANPK